ncbi:7165_t:CDS:10 [Diversispora eburnea]|uniref:Phosphodiesterase n=1 Tax=Diversispora eburnea TaxID=1213867 RepID=A0A9N9BAQ8_9GLOM|nr:7165_t:CDS:10 [Diversispora eburnea]
MSAVEKFMPLVLEAEEEQQAPTPCFTHEGVFTEYFKELEEESIRDNFVIIYELLDEMMDFGYPQTTETKILQEYITQESHKLEIQVRPPMAVTNAVSWRSEGIKHRKNEVFLDVIESVNLLVNSNGNVLRSEILGVIKMKCYLSGMPELRLGLNDKVMFENTGRSPSRGKAIEMEDVKFHQCVRLSRFENDRTISFIPPDGEFELMSYRLNTQVKPLIWVEALVENYAGSRIEYMIKAKAQFKRRSTANNVEIHVPVPDDADSPKFRSSIGSVQYAPEKSCLVWKIKQFQGGKEFLMRAHFGLPSVKNVDDTDKKPPIAVKFEIPYFTTSGIQVRYLKIVEKSGYQALPWVRYITQNGEKKNPFHWLPNLIPTTLTEFLLSPLCMEPSRCSVLVVDRSCTEKTYLPSQKIEFGNSRNSKCFLAHNSDWCTYEVNKVNNQNIDDLIQLFLSIFAEVITVSSGTQALSTLKNRKIGSYPTIVLIDIDHTESISRDLYARRESFLAMTDGVSLKEITTTKDSLYGLEFLKYINSEISQGKLDQVIPIVCSCKDSVEIMVDCLNKGAVDYLIKPIRPEVAKTIFLNIHRSTIIGKRSRSTLKPLIRCSVSYEQRLQEVFSKDQWFQKQFSNVIHHQNLRLISFRAELEKTNFLKKKLVEWEFNPHDLTVEEQFRCVVIIFEHVLELDELKELNVSSEQLHRFLLALRQSYYDTNPYHNFIHAVDVLQAMFYFLCEMDFIPSLLSSRYKRRSVNNSNSNRQKYRPNDLLRDTDAFALLLASIGHDIGHPGVNNKFLIESNTPLAQVYNDRSVLESFHAMALFNLMQKFGFKIYETETIKRFESADFELNTQFQIDYERNIIVGALIKCADISNAARPHPIAKNWSNVLLEEFKCQGDLERKLGLPILPVNDRYSNTKQSDSQIGFIDYVAMPLFKSVGELVPEMGFCLPYIEENKKSWRECIEEEDDGRILRHNSSGNDSGVLVSLDSKQNSPIVVVPAARIMQRDTPGPYLLPIKPLPDRPGSETSPDRDDVVSTTGESDTPLTQDQSKQKLDWSFFARNKPQTGQNITPQDTISYEPTDQEDSIFCCSIQ